VTAAPLDPDLNTLLAGPRVTDFRFDLLDQDEHLLGHLISVRPGGRLSWDFNASIHSSGQFTMTDIGTEQPWIGSIASNPALDANLDGWKAGPFETAWTWNTGAAQVTGTSILARDDAAGFEIQRPIHAAQFWVRVVINMSQTSYVQVGLNFGKTAHDAWAGTFWEPDGTQDATLTIPEVEAGVTTTIDLFVDANNFPPEFVFLGPWVRLPSAGTNRVESIELFWRGSSEVDWLNVRVRPVALLSGTNLAGQDEIALGVYVPAAPVEDWTATGRTWAVELLDKNSILDSDIVTDDQDTPVAYSVPAGANVIDIVRQLIQEIGEDTPAIADDPKSLVTAMVWEIGVTRLKIINDLLHTINYFSLWCDGLGQYQCTPYIEQHDRPPIYTMLTPFTAGDMSLMSPDWKRDRDIYAIPNRYVIVTTGSGDTPAMIAVAMNVHPDSPFSYPSRGRWITQVATGANATDQDDLDAMSRRELTALTSVATTITVSHSYLPDLIMNRAVNFVNPDAGLDIVCIVTKTTIPLDPTALCSTELREACPAWTCAGEGLDEEGEGEGGGEEPP
jgi:hypothetical protein